MISIAALRAMVAAGADATMLLAAIEADHAALEAKLAARRESNRLRQHRHRLSHAVTRDVVTPEQNQQLNSVTDQERDKKEDTLLESKEERVSPRKEVSESKKEKKVSLSVGEPLFSRFWAVRARRTGSDPRQPCEKKFNALVKSGVDPELIIAGAAAHAEAMRTEGKFGTPYVPQTIKFLNQQQYLDYAGPDAAGRTGLLTPEEFRAQWAQREAAKHEKSNGTDGPVQNIQAGRLGIHPEREEDDGQGPLFCDQARNGGMGRLESLLSETVSAVTVGNDRRFTRS